MPKILFYGNSITKHGVKEDIGWYWEHGMAASCPEKDYVHLVAEKLPEYEWRTAGSAEWERGYWTEEPYEAAAEAVRWNPDVVVVRTGENIPGEALEDPGRPLLPSVERLLEALSANGARLVVTTCFWAEPKRDAALREAAVRRGLRPVELGDLGRDPGMRADGLFEHAGVAAHPGDAGMTAIAERVLEAILAEGVFCGTGRAGEGEKIVDFINYVFSKDHQPHDFPTLLPKLYGMDTIEPERHFLAREDGEIRACVGSYPEVLHVGSRKLTMRNIGAVSVHPYTRRKGYMKRCMGLAIEEMRRTGTDMSCLGGQRQRYNYFGYEGAGTAVRFGINPTNLRHAFGTEYAAEYSFAPVGADDPVLEEMRRLHDAQMVHAERPLFWETLRSWNAEPFVILAGGEPVGFLSASADKKRVHELVLADMRTLYGVLRSWFAAFAPGNLEICAAAHQQELIEPLARICEGFSMTNTEMVKIFSYERVTRAFFELQATLRPLADGEMTLAIGGEAPERLRLRVEGGAPSVEALPAGTPCELTLAPNEATTLLFGSLTAVWSPVKDAAVRGWLPLPFTIPDPDRV